MQSPDDRDDEVSEEGSEGLAPPPGASRKRRQRGDVPTLSPTGRRPRGSAPCPSCAGRGWVGPRHKIWTRRPRRLEAGVTHPLTKKKYRLHAPTMGDLKAMVAAWDRVVFDARARRLSDEDVERELLIILGKLPRAWTFRQAFDAWLELQGRTPRAVAKSVWRLHLVPLHGAACAELHDAALLAWKTELERRLAPNTIRAACSIVISALKLAKQTRKIARLPFEEFRAPPVRIQQRRAAATNVTTLAALVRAARELDLAGRAKQRHGRQLHDLEARVTVIALVGLRTGEAAALGWDHVDLERRTITVEYTARPCWRKHNPEMKRPTFPTKGKKARTSRLHPDAYAALMDQKARLEARDHYKLEGPVFPGRGGRWRRSNLAINHKEMRACVKRAELPEPERWCVHSLRHSMISLEIASGQKPRAVQRKVGHASLEQTDHYLHDDDALDESAIPSIRERNTLPWPAPKTD